MKLGVGTVQYLSSARAANTKFERKETSLQKEHYHRKRATPVQPFILSPQDIHSVLTGTNIECEGVARSLSCMGCAEVN